jgi:hypothetical protein
VDDGIFRHIHVFVIPLRGIQLTMLNATEVQLVFPYKMFTFYEANTGVAHFPSVITTIMDHKVQLLKPLNLGELYTAYQNRFCPASRMVFLTVRAIPVLLLEEFLCGFMLKAFL